MHCGSSYSIDDRVTYLGTIIRRYFCNLVIITLKDSDASSASDGAGDRLTAVQVVLQRRPAFVSDFPVRTSAKKSRFGFAAGHSEPTAISSSATPQVYFRDLQIKSNFDFLFFPFFRMEKLKHWTHLQIVNATSGGREILDA